MGAVSAGGKEAAGIAGGASAALSVTRTVSFFKGTLEVILEIGLFSFSLMRSGFVFKIKSNLRRQCQTRIFKKIGAISAVSCAFLKKRALIDPKEPG